MDQNRISTLYKIVLIVFGCACFSYALLNMRMDVISVGFVILLGFALVFVPRISLTLPYSKFAISFSDAIIFLTFLLYGGEAAVVLATLETMAGRKHCREK